MSAFGSTYTMCTATELHVVYCRVDGRAVHQEIGVVVSLSEPRLSKGHDTTSPQDVFVNVLISQRR